MVSTTDPKELIIQQLKDHFRSAATDSRNLGILLYGSIVSGDNHANSDIDICIVAPKQDQYQVYKAILASLRCDFDKFDIRFFDELPLLIRETVIDKGIILHSRDIGELTEYFFFSTRLELEDYYYRLKHIL